MRDEELKKQAVESEAAAGLIHQMVENQGPIAVASILANYLQAKEASVPVRPAETDNWAEKSTFRCQTCQWFVEKEPNHLGRCRRRSPELGGFPVVWPTDWCGDHKLGSPPRF